MEKPPLNITETPVNENPPLNITETPVNEVVMNSSSAPISSDGVYDGLLDILAVDDIYPNAYSVGQHMPTHTLHKFVGEYLQHTYGDGLQGSYLPVQQHDQSYSAAAADHSGIHSGSVNLIQYQTPEQYIMSPAANPSVSQPGQHSTAIVQEASDHLGNHPLELSSAYEPSPKPPISSKGKELAFTFSASNQKEQEVASPYAHLPILESSSVPKSAEFLGPIAVEEPAMPNSSKKKQSKDRVGQKRPRPANKAELLVQIAVLKEELAMQQVEYSKKLSLMTSQYEALQNKNSELEADLTLQRFNQVSLLNRFAAAVNQNFEAAQRLFEESYKNKEAINKLVTQSRSMYNSDEPS